jgi:hypothetical protein
MAKNFNNNFSITIDFLFYVFDKFSLEEKKQILKICQFKSDIKDQSPQNDANESEEIKLEIHPFLEDRLTNLINDCEKIKHYSEAIQFLLFVCSLIDVEILKDFILQYSLEAINVSENDNFNRIGNRNLENRDIGNIITQIPDSTQLQIDN